MKVIADQARVNAIIEQVATAIASDKDRLGADANWALVGIRSRGDLLAQRLAERIGVDQVGTLDITLYRDDLSEIGPQPVVRTTEIPFQIDGLHIILVDDVLMSGRSVRAALQSLMDLGRPRRVWMSVLVDRGGRELPIQPDYVGLDLSQNTYNAALSGSDRVDVLLRPTDDRDAIVVRGPQCQEKGL